MKNGLRGVSSSTRVSESFKTSGELGVNSPVRAAIVPAVVTATCTRAPGPAARRRRTSVRPVVAVHVGVGLVATAARRGRAARLVRVIGVAGARGRVGVVNRGAADARRRARVAVTRVVVVARRRTTAVVVAARTVATGRATAVVVVLGSSSVTASTTDRRAGPIALAGALLLDLVGFSKWAVR